MVLLRPLLTAAALLGASVQAQSVVGTAFGFASGTTGGGNAAPAAPKDTDELKEWLSDSTPRVIVIDKEFNFIGTEDTCTDCECCIPDSNTCGDAGQNAIKTDGSDWCGSYPTTTCTYDNAGLEGLEVASDKSIIGVGDAGVIRGKGLRLVNGVSNIIIQNIHITELNPQYIWGGDAISLDGTDKIWIDHVKVSLVGRQMFVTGYESSMCHGRQHSTLVRQKLTKSIGGSVTVSNSEFDGQTKWSASCDGHHYWSVLGYGKGDQITFANNYVHHTSGRSPKIEFDSHWHAYNNFWENNSGHAFDIGEGANVLIEGNVFSNVKTPMNPEDTPGSTFAATAEDASSCTSALGRPCIANELTSSGELSGNDEAVLSGWPTGEGDTKAMTTDKVPSYVKANAGVGKLGAGSGSTGGASSSAGVTPTPSSSAIPSSSATPSSSAYARRHYARRHHY
ncbi:pectin lyase fold/virulence factor [Aspergillus pseudocaelatus]|uniref:pectin lyase n=1 Tax=Aspergillus pseudocaelatus TaxID=1825620 RepID=A0ABQ6W3F6_9EURO|nr:pectin lyase fold/virulence factor [Aspergillus pseudocaelatus]